MDPGLEDRRHRLAAARPRGLGEAGRPLSVPERIRWTVELLGVRPSERMLEVGCGPGLAAALVCERLVDGVLLATDRSAAQIERARQRNQAHLESGSLELRTDDLAALEVDAGSFDTVFAVDVNVFWVGPATRELAVVRRALAPDGRLVLVYETSASAWADDARERLSAVLATEGFAPREMRTASATRFACTTRPA